MGLDKRHLEKAGIFAGPVPPILHACCVRGANALSWGPEDAERRRILVSNLLVPGDDLLRPA